MGRTGHRIGFIQITLSENICFRLVTSSKSRNVKLSINISLMSVCRGAATDSGPPGQHIHSGPPAFQGEGGGGVIYYRNRDCVPEPIFFSPSPK